MKPMTYGQQSMLDTAAEKEAVCSLASEQDGQWSNDKSNLIDFVHPECLRINIPVRDGIPVHYKVGQRLDVSFRRGHSKVVFESNVRALGRHRDIDYLEISRPSSLYSLPRRVYERTSANFSLQFWFRANQQQVYKGTSRDISAGGMSFITRDRLSTEMIGRTLLCSITLRHRTVEVDAIIRQIESIPENPGTLLIKVQFVGMAISAFRRKSLMSIASETKQMQQTLMRQHALKSMRDGTSISVSRRRVWRS
jgi:c-di-GMP-binding flagellar brake protein YcgR